MTTTKISLQGFTADGEFYREEIELDDATLDLTIEGSMSRWSLKAADDGVHASIQGSSRTVVSVLPVSSNSVRLTEIER